jgi:hypothetical protein
MLGEAVPKNRENEPEKPKGLAKLKRRKDENESNQRLEAKQRPISVGKPSRLAHRHPKQAP